MESVGKARYVREMFGRIVPRYDLMNFLISVGQDGRWRRLLSQEVAVKGEGLVLDVATGTGAQAFSLIKQGSSSVVGIDFTAGMLARAGEKADSASLSLVQGDALNLPFTEGAFTAATTSFAMRNVEDIERAFQEMQRVVRPGGRVGCLEISLPTKGLFRSLFHLYFYRLVPILGGLISGQPDAYSYLPHSLDNFPAAEEIAEVMRRVGLRDVRFEQLNGGSLTLHIGTVAG